MLRWHAYYEARVSPDLKVIQMRESTLRDVPAVLRKIADEVERGEHGHVTCCAIAMLGQTFDVFACGDGIQQDGMGPSAALMFHAAALRFAKQIEQHGL